MCPQDWIRFGCSCYYVSTVNKTWAASRQDCLDRGADLVIINSREEQAFLRSINCRAWIGMTDSDVKFTWRWVDGTLLTTSYWRNVEPNNQGGSEDCVEIWPYLSDPLLGWNDQPCDYQQSSICERPII
ncbi:hypothetical protein DPEC_G00296560 [Dallia pectoralis]|uniref:Uncharacterized protein n=1 Tax=Dallia pectoralis TaxID=75939 RepID=A0ACC2FFI6_DALPE|nr:hypothetical protein DPEC_G00296560 [Dallia pectoralis]